MPSSISVETLQKWLAARVHRFQSRNLGPARDPSNGKFRRWVAVGGAFGLLTVLALLATAVCSYAYLASQFVPPSELNINQPSTGAKILDRNGRLLYQYVDDRDGLRVPVPLKEVSIHLVAATIATEDESFFTNPGVNSKGILRALWENFNPFSGQFLDGSGGSSITQQLVKNVYISDAERDDRTLARKVREATYAIELTNRYDKDQILEWYLNQISYGGVFNGIESASQGYFSKAAKDLTLAEAALLAGIPSSPAAYSPILNPDAALERRNQVLDLLAQHSEINLGTGRTYHPSRQAIAAAKSEPLNLAPQQFSIEAPHFVLSYVQPWIEAHFGKNALYREGLVITTSIDLELQHRAETVLEEWVGAYEEESNSRNGAIVVIDPRSGEILTMIGSRDYWRDDIQGRVNNVTALNSPGSTFKPFVYLTAFEALRWSPGRLIDDSPVAYEELDGSIFRPRNPTGAYYGPITIRNALGNSLNVAAFKAAMSVGVPDIVSLARRMGFTTLEGSYGPAIAIGGVDLTALDLSYAYGVLANGGVIRGELSGEQGIESRQLDPISVLRIEDSNGRVRFDITEHRAEQRVITPELAFFINDILSDPNARCLTFGCGGLAIPGLTMAIKTGTSEPFAIESPNAGKIGDTWAFGYTPEVVIGVWAGNADNAPITNITSATIAFQTMRDVALAYFDGNTSTPFSRPDGVAMGQVCASGGSSYVEDWVLRPDLSSTRCSPNSDDAPAPRVEKQNGRSGEPKGNQGQKNRGNNGRKNRGH